MKDDFAKYLTRFFTSYLSGERGLSHNTIRAYGNLNSNHREVNRQYYPTEQLRQSNAIKKNDSTHKA